MKKHILYYEAMDITKGTVKYAQRTEGSATKARESELGIIYLKKWAYIELGHPQVLRIVVEVDTEPADPFPEAA